jgi:hypothetical protein
MRFEILGSAVFVCQVLVFYFLFPIVGSVCHGLTGVTVADGMWKDVEMARLVAINTTQPITKEAATVRQRMNTIIAVQAHNISLRHLRTFVTNTMICCKLLFLNVVL